jgi:hypothetical protein
MKTGTYSLSQIRQHTVCPYKTDTFLSQSLVSIPKS